MSNTLPPAKNDSDTRGRTPDDITPPANTLLHVRGLKKYFPIRGGLLGRAQAWVQAVDGIDFSVAKGPDFIQGQPVSFTIVGAGTIAPSSAVTGPDGFAQVVYTAPASASGTDTIRISVSDGVVSGTAQIDVRFA